MSITRDIATHDNAVAYGGLIDAIGGVATIVLVICGLVGIAPPMMVAIATIVFGVALLIQGGAMLSEYMQVVFPGGVRTASVEQMGGNSLALVFLVGAAGIVLGVLSLLGISAAILTPVAAIGYGTALLLSSNAVWRLYVLRRASAQMETAIGQSQHVGAEMLASEMASGSAGIQALAGLAAIVLGILALAGSPNDLTLNLVALLALGSTIVLTGSTLSATVLSFMRT
ncbi:hypothetical protein [Methylocystis rosea]|jgi:hypothetical protein|uniref:Uncharacterized protein n=1 Tax=Methylocystis rosea TaxID=173366 RepID=A0ABX6EJL2_9HYPH|nr:hypothetical protein [Methylocystis rosea]QGM94933.1 hypothetical protein F7D13_13365 [Methylocystis rosea]